MKIKIFGLMRVVAFVFFVGFFLYSIYSIDNYRDEKEIIDGERYSKLEIIKTLEKEKGVFYFLGDEENQIEVNKRYYDIAIEAYKDSLNEK